MARMPTPGGDNGSWGDILNDFLRQAHTDTGSLKPDSVDTSHVRDGAITRSKTASTVQTSLDAADNAIPSSQKGAADGVATLDSSSKLATAQLPTTVATKSTNSADTGRALDAYTGAPLVVVRTSESDPPTTGEFLVMQSNGTVTGGTGTSGAAQIVDGGDLGATYTLDVASAPRTQFQGVLTAGLVLTLEGMPAGGEVVLLLSQDAIGGHSATVSFDGDTQPLDIALADGADSVLYLHSPDGAELFVSGGSPADGGTSVALSTINAKGDLLVGSANDTVARLPVGTNGQVLAADSTAATGIRWADPTGIGALSNAEYGMHAWADSGILLENMPRHLVQPVTPVALTTSGVLRIFPIGRLRAGTTYSGMRLACAGTAASGLTQQWACILSYPGRVVRAVSADLTTDPWGQTIKTFTFGTPYTPSVDEVVLGGLCLTASTHPALVLVGGVSVLVGSVGSTTQISGPSNSGLTAPLSVGATANALGASTTQATSGVPYVGLV